MENRQGDDVSEVVKEKLERLNEIENHDAISDADRAFLAACSEDNEAEIRCCACTVLARFPSEESEQILLARLTDTDDMVRVCACDSLAFSHSESTLHALKRAAKDKAYLVRGYAALSIADVQKNLASPTENTVNFLENRLAFEKSKWVKIMIYSALISLGCGRYQEELTSFVNDRLYRNRCAALSRIKDLICAGKLDDLAALEKALVLRRKKEKSRAVKVSLDEAIRLVLQRRCS